MGRKSVRRAGVVNAATAGGGGADAGEEAVIASLLPTTRCLLRNRSWVDGKNWDPLDFEGRNFAEGFMGENHL